MTAALGTRREMARRGSDLIDVKGNDDAEVAAIDGAYPRMCRVHYRTPSEPGNSGSPVFNSMLWEVMALHHAGGKMGMPKLNGKAGTYAANEGIALQSIVAAMKG